MTLRFLAGALLLTQSLASIPEQRPLIPVTSQTESHVEHASSSRKLNGRFLHITDFHPDSFYKAGSSPDEACHRGKGTAGIFGAENTDCDSPLTLINATFRWIDENLKNDIDFVIWTGDSARHDSDDRIPRTKDQIVGLNEMLVEKFVEVFGDDQHPTKELKIPIIPTFGNNDIMPHNIFDEGPNFWTKRYLSIWERFVPESQRHSFARGGWFYVEAIPHRLAVFSLNTLYFFDSNSAVDGCSERSEPGYEHFEWLRVQLQFMRERGMKAILTGHVPPARTDSKQSWDETCWQKYALWMRQYRDVIVGSAYGHMNIDHFMFQDFKDIKKKTSKGRGIKSLKSREELGDRISTLKKSEYLTDLRLDWSDIPEPPGSESTSDGCVKLRTHNSDVEEEKKKNKYFEDIGGPWGESYSLSLVSASIVPNYFPTMRVVGYNISGLDGALSTPMKASAGVAQAEVLPDSTGSECNKHRDDAEFLSKTSSYEKIKTKKRDTKKSKSKSHKRKFTVPQPPSSTAPPGPAYSPQTFSWLSYTQYFANFTKSNDNDHTIRTPHPKDKNKHDIPRLDYEVEYSTNNDSTWCLPDLTVRSYLDLARLIGRYEPPDGGDINAEDGSDPDAASKKDKKKHKKKKKHHKNKDKTRARRDANRAWFTFVKRAFVGAVPDDELKDEFSCAV